MAITANKCFGTVKRLKTVEPKLLCRAVAEFPVDLKRAKVALPSADEADFENMPYDDLAAMVLKGEMSDEFGGTAFQLGVAGQRGRMVERREGGALLGPQDRRMFTGAELFRLRAGGLAK